MVDDDTQTLLRTIGANVTRVRKRLRLTQAQLAEAAECEPSYVQKVEYGTAVPTLQMLVRLAKALKVPVAQLFRTAKPRKVSRGRPRGVGKSA